MAAQTYNVEIQGYWRDTNKSRIPNDSGVYFVYDATHNKDRGSHVLCFSGLVESANRERVEAAYIFKHEPPANEDYLNSFPFDETTVKSKGKVVIFHTDFSVHRTRKLK